MSNTKIDIKSTFFLYDKDDGMYKCTINKCSTRLKGALNSLKRHIAILHPDVSKTIGLDKYNPNLSLNPDRLTEPKAKKLKTVQVEVDPDDFTSGLVELASIQGVSLNLFDSSGFKKTGGILAKALGVLSHTDAIVSLVQKVARHVREIVSDEMLKTLFCLKFDGAVRRHRKILGITAQYIINGKIVSRILSIEDMTERQTGENLKERINDVLSRFKVNIKHVYASTTDNGRNMVKCTEILRKQQELEIQDDLLELKMEEPEEMDEELERKLVEEDNEVDELIATVDEIIDNDDGCIESIKCGAHTFNLIVKDALGTVNSDWLLEIIKFVKLARRVEYRALFDLAKISLPKPDVETRWSSTWDMVEGILVSEQTVKEIGAKCPALKLTDETWHTMKEFQCAFKHLYAAITALQSETIIMGDLLKIIKQCQFQIKKLPADNPFAQGLTDAIARRLKNLVDNNAFRAAILFDQRWCFLDSPFFSKDDKLQAIVSICTFNVTTDF